MREVSQRDWARVTNDMVGELGPKGGKKEVRY